MVGNKSIGIDGPRRSLGAGHAASQLPLHDGRAARCVVKNLGQRQWRIRRQ